MNNVYSDVSGESDDDEALVFGGYFDDMDEDDDEDDEDYLPSISEDDDCYDIEAGPPIHSREAVSEGEYKSPHDKHLCRSVCVPLSVAFL